MSLLAALGIAGLGLQAFTGVLNYGEQKKNRETQLNLQREAWDREDTAYSRAARDLERAGLSKTLAAGEAAPTSAPIKTEAPQLSGIPKAEQLVGLMAGAAQIDKTRMETAYINSQKQQAEANTKFLESKTYGQDITNYKSKETIDSYIQQAKAAASMADHNELLQRYRAENAKWLAQHEREKAYYESGIKQFEYHSKEHYYRNDGVEMDLAREMYLNDYLKARADYMRGSSTLQNMDVDYLEKLKLPPLLYRGISNTLEGAIKNLVPNVGGKIKM